MAKNLYVGNLPYTINEDQLRSLFAQAGEVSTVNIIVDRDSDRPRGFAFVEMSTQEAANEAIKRFNGYQLDGRNLTVNEARPREERSGDRERTSTGRGRRDRY